MREHRVFVFVKQQGVDVQNGVTEELAAADAKAVGAEVAQDLLAYIYNTRRKGTRTSEGTTCRDLLLRCSTVADGSHLLATDETKLCKPRKNTMMSWWKNKKKKEKKQQEQMQISVSQP